MVVVVQTPAILDKVLIQAAFKKKLLRLLVVLMKKAIPKRLRHPVNLLAIARSAINQIVLHQVDVLIPDHEVMKNLKVQFLLDLVVQATKNQLVQNPINRNSLLQSQCIRGAQLQVLEVLDLNHLKIQ